MYALEVIKHMNKKRDAHKCPVCGCPRQHPLHPDLKCKHTERSSAKPQK